MEVCLLWCLWTFLREVLQLHLPDLMQQWLDGCAGLHPHSSYISCVRWITLSYLWVLEVQGTLYLAAQQHLFLLAGRVYLEAQDSLCHLCK